jgi:predicted transcriptional regulator YdeE
VPQDAMLKVVPPANYAVAKIDAGTSLVDTWTEFFYTAIPSRGFAPDESHGFYFEYYPKTTDGDCELWVPVVEIK